MPTKSLLVVDDNAVLREGLAAVLRKEGYTVAVAADGADAIAHLANEPGTDLVLLDMMMPPPALDGWRFLELRKQNSKLAAIAVLVITGLDIASPEWTASLGAAGCIKKPVDKKVLFAEVRRCCGLPPDIELCGLN
jgi:two-component system, chemotaxis family, chemotaxis protein CheY